MFHSPELAASGVRGASHKSGICNNEKLLRVHDRAIASNQVQLQEQETHLALLWRGLQHHENKQNCRDAHAQESNCVVWKVMSEDKEFVVSADTFSMDVTQ